MKNYFLFSLLLAIVHLANAQDTIEPNAAKNQRFFFGFRPGFNVMGIGNELETAMRQDGRLNGEGFFSQDYPRARISAGFLSAFEYKKDPLALGIEIGSVAVGKTRGLMKWNTGGRSVRPHPTSKAPAVSRPSPVRGRTTPAPSPACPRRTRTQSLP
ncbi:MAG: hypothetical protein MUC59_18725 [Saprospiraceae bacterium]|nr:hypothetical protein [Saprospiraceae bacterium]